MRIAIVGAGIAGLSCADTLSAAGHEPVLFDKGRGPGGRMSVRRVVVGDRTITFDHGAQYFSARDPAFIRQVDAWAAAGVAARWPAAGDDAWVGTPAMNAPVRSLAAHHDVRWETRIDALVRATDGWTLIGAEAGVFDAMVVATPAEQAVALLAPHDTAFVDAAAASHSAPCWTGMAAFDARLDIADDILRDKDAIGWAARNSAKPGRAGPEAWVIQASPDWSVAHLEDTREDVAAALLALFAARAGVSLPAPISLTAHRWRYARSAPAGASEQVSWAPDARIGVCGDWRVAPRVEAAWLSGRRLAEVIGS